MCPDAVFPVLYSILFCSKLGSSRYSCKAPASDTGALPMFRRGIEKLKLNTHVSSWV